MNTSGVPRLSLPYSFLKMCVIAAAGCGLLSSSTGAASPVTGLPGGTTTVQGGTSAGVLGGSSHNSTHLTDVSLSTYSPLSNVSQVIETTTNNLKGGEDIVKSYGKPVNTTTSCTSCASTSNEKETAAVKRFVHNATSHAPSNTTTGAPITANTTTSSSTVAYTTTGSPRSGNQTTASVGGLSTNTTSHTVTSGPVIPAPGGNPMLNLLVLLVVPVMVILALCLRYLLAPSAQYFPQEQEKTNGREDILLADFEKEESGGVGRDSSPKMPLVTSL